MEGECKGACGANVPEDACKRQPDGACGKQPADIECGRIVPWPPGAHGEQASKWVMDVCGDVESLELATTAKERLRGMLFRDRDDVTRVLIPCHDIHTFGMRYPIDVAFISRDGRVLEVHRNVSTFRRLRRKDASLVAERFSRSGDWLRKGDVIRIGSPRRA